MNLDSLLSIFRIPHLRGSIGLLRDLQPFLRIHFLSAAHELGLLDALQTPTRKDDLHARLGIRRPEMFESMLEMGVALGELGRRGERYYLKGQRAQALVGSSGDPLAAFLLEHVSYHGSVYRHLAERVRGEPPGDYLAETGDLVARSSRVIEPFIANFVRRLVRSICPSRLLEIGCGSGIYLRHAAEAHPALTGVALELQPQVAEQARQNLNGWGLGARFEVLAGDIRCPPPNMAGPFDLVTLYNNIYYFSTEERQALFPRLLSYLRKGAPLALVSPMQGTAVETLNFDLVLQSTQGCTRLPAMNELLEQLRAAGFNHITTQSLGPGQVLYGVLAFK